MFIISVGILIGYKGRSLELSPPWPMLERLYFDRTPEMVESLLLLLARAAFWGGVDSRLITC